MPKNKVVINGVTQIDLSPTTAGATDVASGKYFFTADGTLTLGTGSGGGGSYVRTVIVPQQTVTMTTIDSHTAAYLSTAVNTLETGADYIITFNGTEYWYTCQSAWYGSVLGDLNYLWGTDTEQVYPFLIQDYSTASSLVLFAYDGYVNTNVSIKVEKVELLSGGTTLTTKTITQNGTYSASSDSADGYSSVTVNVSGGVTPTGTLNITSNNTYDVTNYASAIVNVPGWTKVAETSYQVSTTSTSAATVETWETGHSELWTSGKWLYVRIRDTAGKRNGYFYGSDQFFYNVNVVNGISIANATTALRIYIRYSDNKFTVAAGTGTTGYGVYADAIYTDGRVRIRSRYNSTSSLTINGTYKVEVYLLDPPTGAPIFT